MPLRSSSTYRKPPYTSGDGVDGPAWGNCQAIASVDFSFAFGVMSPDAPGLTANNGRLPPPAPIPPPGPPRGPPGPFGKPPPAPGPPNPAGPPPEPTKSRSSPATGVALIWPIVPFNSQSCLPVSGSYDRTFGLPMQTTSVRTLFFHTSGLLQPVRSVRGVLHSSLPVFASRATRNDFSSLSD